MREAGLPFCFPDVSASGAGLQARDLFDLALARRRVPAGQAVVTNELDLTEAERIVVITGLLALAVAWGARRSDGAGQEQAYVVRSGDTLWSIARSVSGDADVRGVVDAIQQLKDGYEAVLG